MSLGFAQALMLLGLATLAIPVVIHLFRFRRLQQVDWGAVMFLESAERARKRPRISELMLMLARMALLALVVFALARPSLRPSATTQAGEPTGQGLLSRSGSSRRDLVVILDGSAAMRRKGRTGTLEDRAIEVARRLVSDLGSGDTVAILRASDRVAPVLAPPTSDPARARSALASLPPAWGRTDLMGALVSAFEILRSTTNPAREIVVIAADRRDSWRPGDPERWNFLRRMWAAMPERPSIRVLTLEADADPESADGSVSEVRLARRLLSPGGEVEVEATITNAGPAPLSRTAVLCLDGVAVAGTEQPVGPLSAGSRATLTFSTTMAEPGSSAVSIRLLRGAAPDPQPLDDERSRVIEVVPAFGVVLVEGEPSLEPLGGDIDFLRAALAPAGDNSPQFETRVVAPESLDQASLREARVLVLADVAQLSPKGEAAVAELLARGGGVLVVLGNRTDPAVAARWFADGRGWLPARIGARQGGEARNAPPVRLDPSSFRGPVLEPLGRGETPPLGRAGLFSWWSIEVPQSEPAAEIRARLANGQPWLVERRFREGRVALLTGSLDAQGGTIPANPDFVPLVHELMLDLAGASTDAPVHIPGEPWIVPLDLPPSPDVNTLRVDLPSGRAAEARVVRSGTTAEAELGDTSESGLYRLRLSEPPGGQRLAEFANTNQEPDPTPLTTAEQEQISREWPLRFEANEGSLLADSESASLSATPRALWPGLLVGALGFLCFEVWITRSLARRAAQATSA